MIHLTSAEKRVMVTIALVVAISASVSVAVKKFPFLKNAANLLESPELYPKVDINRASYQQLVDLPYLGDKTAKAIIAYREEFGRFTSADDLVKVKGISFGNLAKFKPYLRIK